MKIEGFYYGTVAEGLSESERDNKSLAFMPQVVEARIGNKYILASEAYKKIWDRIIGTLSIKVTGKDTRGKKVILYAHTPHYFCNPENIRGAKDINGALVMPKEAFNGLLKKVDGEKIFAVDYDQIKESPNIVPLCEALSHPEVIPFLGKYGAKGYLKSRNVGLRKAGMLQIEREDDVYSQPLARFLCLSDRSYGGGLNGFEDFNSTLRFPALGLKLAGNGLKHSGLKLEALAK